MRIAQLSSMTGFYGGEVHLVALAEGLRRRGHDVRAVVRPRSALARRLGEAGLPVVTMPLVDWYEPRGTLDLHAWLRDEGIDILHAHVPRDWYTAAVASLGLPVALVGTRHRLDPIGCAPLKRPFLGRFAALVAVSEAVRAPLVAGRFLPSDRVVTVPNGVSLPAAALDRAEARRVLGLPAAGRVIGCVGRLDPDKGVDVLLEAMARVRRTRPDLVLAIVGDGAPGGRCRTALESRAAVPDLAGAVRFCGYREDAARLAAAFDVQAVPSRAEPFGLVLLEAMVRGVPLVATAAGGVPEIVRDGREGMLVPPDDAEALAGALATLLDDPALGARLAAGAKRRVGADFGCEGMLDGIEAVYARALRLQRHPRAAGWTVNAASTARPAPHRR